MPPYTSTTRGLTPIAFDGKKHTIQNGPVNVASARQVKYIPQVT